MYIHHNKHSLIMYLIKNFWLFSRHLSIINELNIGGNELLYIIGKVLVYILDFHHFHWLVFVLNNNWLEYYENYEQFWRIKIKLTYYIQNIRFILNLSLCNKMSVKEIITLYTHLCSSLICIILILVNYSSLMALQIL